MHVANPRRKPRKHEDQKTQALLKAHRQTQSATHKAHKLVGYQRAKYLRHALVKRGIVEHRISPLDALQRAIDDTTLDYLLLRQRVDLDIQDPENPNQQSADALPEHPLYEPLLRTREAMVRYATFAIQYQIQERQTRLSEARIALLAVALKDTLQQLGLDQNTINQVPKLLINTLERKEKLTPGSHYKARAVAEIFDGDAEVVIEDVTTNPHSNPHPNGDDD